MGTRGKQLHSDRKADTHPVVYDIQRAVADGATVPIFYESRLASLELSKAERPHIDPEFDEATKGEEVERKEKLKRGSADYRGLQHSGFRVDVGR